MSWFQNLQAASFRGVPFGVLTSDGRFGRRLAVHEYPYRDKPYVEDLGRATRRIGITGFLIESSLIYGGGEVIAQREQMIAAAETSGPGKLVHPTLGELQVSCESLAVNERWEQGRFFELGFSFYEAGERVFPTITGDTGSATDAAADDADDAAASDFSTRSDTDLLDGAAVGDQAGATTQAWAASIAAQGRDATSTLSLASLLQGSFGRFAAGRNVGGFGSALPGSTAGTINDLVALAAGRQSALSNSLEQLTSAVGDLGL